MTGWTVGSNWFPQFTLSTLVGAPVRLAQGGVTRAMYLCRRIGDFAARTFMVDNLGEEWPLIGAVALTIDSTVLARVRNL